MAKQKAEQKNIIIILSLVVLILLILTLVSPFWLSNLINKVTGKSVIVGGAICVDNDGGDNPFLQGSVDYNSPDMGIMAVYTDKCQDANKRLKEVQKRFV